MFGRLLAGLIVVGLAIGVWLMWPEGENHATTTSIDVAGETTTTTTGAPSSTTTVPSTTATSDELEIIDTVEEAEALLRELWFGWFEGIYNQDEDRIKEVVASQNQLDAARGQFGQMEFSETPTPKNLDLSDTEILRSDSSCTAIWSSLTVGFRNGSTSGVHVLRSVGNGWRLINLWPLRGDLWDQDCEASLEPLS